LPLVDAAQLVVEAPDEGLRKLFDAFGLELLYDKAERMVTIRVTVSETTAHALQLPRGTVCVQTEAAGGAAQPFPFFVLCPLREATKHWNGRSRSGFCPLEESNLPRPVKSRLLYR
jgi:hypothetical protein